MPNGMDSIRSELSDWDMGSVLGWRKIDDKENRLRANAEIVRRTPLFHARADSRLPRPVIFEISKSSLRSSSNAAEANSGLPSTIISVDGRT